jgi:exodeoxyribonuclease-1
MSRDTFLWHDYETFGVDPALDRPAQFAALRTSEDLEPVGGPMTLFCRPADDLLPHPGACLVTGITPQQALREGVTEVAFAQAIFAAMSEPATSSAGYNSLRFDDEFSRHLFCRNFLDPYAREWRNGNSRFDLIDLVRMCYALRPDGIQWPEHEPGVPSFRLEDLTAANAIEHSGAHDAMVDVRATIALARLLRQAQPKLWQWGLSMRDQKAVMGMLNVVDPQPLVHTSSRYPASRGCTTVVLPMAVVPDRPKSVFVVDLASDPSDWLELDAQDIADRVFTPAADMPEDVMRIPLKAVHSNKLPMLAPLAVLQGADLQRIGIDLEVCQQHAALLRQHLTSLRPRLMSVFMPPSPGDGERDPDLQLYSGGFIPDADRALMQQVLASKPEQLSERDWNFRDRRLPQMLFRLRARNHPQTLDAAELQRWDEDRRERLLGSGPERQLSLAQFHLELAAAREQRAGDARALQLLDELEAWSVELHLQ